MRIKPLKGKALIQQLPPSDKTDSGLWIPDVANDTPRGEKVKPIRGLVKEIGPWRTVKSGHSVMPHIKVGDEVIATVYGGVRLEDRLGDRLRLVDVESILAVIES